MERIREREVKDGQKKEGSESNGEMPKKGWRTYGKENKSKERVMKANWSLFLGRYPGKIVSQSYFI